MINSKSRNNYTKLNYNLYKSQNEETLLSRDNISLKSLSNDIESLLIDLENSLLNISKNYFSHLNKLQINVSFFSKVRKQYINILYDSLNNLELVKYILEIKTFDYDTYIHSLNVANISLLIGIKLDLSTFKLKTLFSGALIHDIGKLFIPLDIINKNGPLTDDEYNLMKTHTIKGYEYILNSNLSTEIKTIVNEHHERVDGNGYPKRKTQNHISTLSKIVSISDVFDALTSDRPYRKALPIDFSISYIEDNCNVFFDYNIVKHILH